MVTEFFMITLKIDEVTSILVITYILPYFGKITLILDQKRLLRFHLTLRKNDKKHLVMNYIDILLQISSNNIVHNIYPGWLMKIS